MSEYFDVWKKKMKSNGGNISQARLNSSKNFYNLNFKDDPSYKISKLHKHDLTIEENIDTRLVNIDRTTNEKKIYFRPDSDIKVGTYVEYNNGKTYLIYEFEDNLLSPCGKVYYCNNSLNAKNWKEPVLGYFTNSAFGVKGVLDSEYLSSIDGQLKSFVQDNEITSQIPIDMRFIFDFDKKQVYKVIKSETITTGRGQLRMIVYTKDTENSDKDDFVNNIAYNEFLDTGNVTPIPTTNTYNIVSKTGVLSIRWFCDNIFKIVDSNGVDDTNNWTITVDQTGLPSGFITIKSMTSNSVTILNNNGYSRTSIKVKFVKGSDVLEVEVKLVK